MLTARMLPKNVDMWTKNHSLLSKSSYKFLWIKEKEVKRLKKKKNTGGETETTTDINPPQRFLM